MGNPLCGAVKRALNGDGGVGVARLAGGASAGNRATHRYEGEAFQLHGFLDAAFGFHRVDCDAGVVRRGHQLEQAVPEVHFLLDGEFCHSLDGLSVLGAHVGCVVLGCVGVVTASASICIVRFADRTLHTFSLAGEFLPAASFLAAGSTLIRGYSRQQNSLARGSAVGRGEKVRDTEDKEVGGTYGDVEEEQPCVPRAFAVCCSRMLVMQTGGQRESRSSCRFLPLFEPLLFQNGTASATAAFRTRPGDPKWNTPVRAHQSSRCFDCAGTGSYSEKEQRLQCAAAASAPTGDLEEGPRANSAFQSRQA